MKGTAGEQRERRREPEMVDRESRDQRPDESRGRIAEREQAEVARALRRAAELAGHILRSDLEDHEAGAENRRAREQDRQSRKRDRKRGAHGDRRRAEEHRPAHADAVREAPGRNREHHRKERVERHQHADRERRRAFGERRERNGHPASAQHRMIRDAEQDEPHQCAASVALASGRAPGIVLWPSRREPLDDPPRRNRADRGNSVCGRAAYEGRPCQNSSIEGARR